MAGKRSEVSQIILRNTTDDSGKWTDMHISLGSWVTIRPSQRGKFAVKKRKLNDLAAHWKARVVGFVLREGGRCVDELVIEHAYGPQDMMTQGIANSPSFPKLDANCICSSEFKDKTPAQSVASVLEVHHHVVGSLLYPDVALSSLRDRGVWFHKYHYTIPSGNIGKLALVDAPTLLTLSSGISDMHIVSAYRCHLTREVGKAMTERGGVRGGLKAFIPLSVFAFMFKEVQTLKVTPQTYTFRNVSGASLNQIFLGEWGKKIHETAGQLTSFQVDLSSFIFKYRVSKQMLYCNFFIQRHKKQWENGEWCWKPVEEHVIRADSMQLSVDTGNGSTKILDVEEGWTLLECRRLLESLNGFSDFYFLKDDKKVGYRRECSLICKDCMFPHTLRIQHLN